MTVNSVEKLCFVVWNVIQNALLTLKPVISCFHLEQHYQRHCPWKKTLMEKKTEMYLYEEPSLNTYWYKVHKYKFAKNTQ